MSQQNFTNIGMQPQPGSGEGYVRAGPGYAPNPNMPVVQQPGSNTTIVINQQVVQRQLKDWSSGLCACFDDMSICLCVTFCGLCAACRLADDLGEHMCIGLCVPNWLNVVRTKLRTQLGIQGTICNDCCMSTYCGLCTMCQVMREVKLAKAAGQL